MPAGDRIHPRVTFLELRDTPATFTVTNFGFDGQPGSLRAVVAQAKASPGPDVIEFASFDDTASVILTLGGLALDSDLTLRGPGADRLQVINVTTGSGVFSVPAGVTVTVSGLRITGGDAGIGGGGGVTNAGDLTLDRVAVTGNKATSNNLSNRLVVSGTVNGGGIYNTGTLAVQGSLIASNEVRAGKSNLTEARGGGLFNQGIAVVINSTIAYNSAFGDGGRFASGGGAYNLGTMTVVFSTVDGNFAAADSPLAGGLYQSVAADGAFTIGHTIAAGNVTLAGGVLGGPQYQPDVRGAFAAVGYNLIQVPGSATGFGPSDLLGIDPLLDPLGDYGGPTQTFRPGAGSPALDAGIPGATGFPPTDQRGSPRPANGRVDIGAYEAAPPVSDGGGDPGGNTGGGGGNPGGGGTSAGAGGSNSGGTGGAGGGSSPATGQPVVPTNRPRVTAVGTAGTARFLNADGSVRFEVAPYGDGFAAGVRVAVGDVNGDGTPDLITAPGPGGVPLVRVFSGTDGTPLGQFFAFEPTFLGGVYVAAADLDRDGTSEIVVAPDEAGGPRVRVLRGANAEQVVANFFGIDDPDFRGGVRVSAGDVTGDGVPDLVIAAGFGGGPRVTVYDGAAVAAAVGGAPAGVPLANFFAFEDTLRNGVYVAAGDLNGDAHADLVFGGGPGGGPRVLAWDGRQLLARGPAEPVVLANFYAGDDSLRGGVLVAVGDLNGDGRGDVVTVVAGGPGAEYAGPALDPAAGQAFGGSGAAYPAAEPLPPLSQPTPGPPPSPGSVPSSQNPSGGNAPAAVQALLGTWHGHYKIQVKDVTTKEPLVVEGELTLTLSGAFAGVGGGVEDYSYTGAITVDNFPGYPDQEITIPLLTDRDENIYYFNVSDSVTYTNGQLELAAGSLDSVPGFIRLKAYLENNQLVVRSASSSKQGFIQMENTNYFQTTVVGDFVLTR